MEPSIWEKSKWRDKKHPDVVILGAGLTGLSTAYHAQKRNIRYEIYEKNSSVGGLCRSVSKDGFIFDYTGHLLHICDSYVKRFIAKLLGTNIAEHLRKSYIYSSGIYTRYPFQANTYGLPSHIIKECIMGFVEAQCNSSMSERRANQNLSFYDWIIASFGRGIAEYFMVPYNTKLWTMHPKNLTCEWMGDYVPRVSLEEVISGAFTEQKKNIGYNSFFCYPRKNGIQALPDSFLPHIKNLHYGSTLTKILLSERKVEFNHIGQMDYRTLVSTIPLPELIRLIDNVPDAVRKASDNLKYTSVLNINIGVGRNNISRSHWVYFPENKYIFYRAGFPMNFSSFLRPAHTSSIYTEISYRPQQKRDMLMNRKKIVRNVISDLVKAGILLKTDKIITTCILDIEYAYVIYDKKRTENLRIIQEFLIRNNIHSIGRYGGWNYSTMEDAILAGRKTIDYL